MIVIAFVLSDGDWDQFDTNKALSPLEVAMFGEILRHHDYPEVIAVQGFIEAPKELLAHSMALLAPSEEMSVRVIEVEEEETIEEIFAGLRSASYQYDRCFPPNEGEGDEWDSSESHATHFSTSPSRSRNISECVSSIVS